MNFLKRNGSKLFFIALVLIILNLILFGGRKEISNESVLEEVVQQEISESKQGNDFKKTIISKVISGEVIETKDGKKIRYIGLDSFGEEAILKGKELVEGKEVRLEKDNSIDKDEDGNLFYYVYVGDVFVNEFMLANGLAAFDLDLDSANLKHGNILSRAEDQAMRNNLGLWKPNSCKEYHAEEKEDN